jgi:hypothetical protein
MEREVVGISAEQCAELFLGQVFRGHILPIVTRRVNVIKISRREERSWSQRTIAARVGSETLSVLRGLECVTSSSY